MTTLPLTESQVKALDVIRASGAAYVGNRTWPQVNTVNARTAESLVRLGICEIFHGPDGRFVRKVAR